MITRRFAEFVVDTRATDIPDAALESVRYALIDTVGCALAGTPERVAQIALSYVREIGAHAQAGVWGTSLRTSPAEAAFANSVASHVLDFDDSLPSLRGHPSATTVPVALAVGEVTGASGESVLAALALGLEIAGKYGRAVGDGHYLRGWHTTATIGALSATAVAARLWGLDANELACAWGLAASQSSGLVRNFCTMTKSFNAGHAARVGVTSAALAHRGFTADSRIFDGDNNFFATYGSGDGEPPASLGGKVGRPWEAIDPGIFVKEWPCCYANHRPIGGLFKLLADHAIVTDEIEAVEIGFLPGSDSALISSNPQTALEAKFSIEYVAAAVILDRKVTLDSFTDEMVQRPQIRALMAKVHRRHLDDAGVYSGLSGYTDVSITSARGRFATRVERTPGSPEWPMSEAHRLEKFLDCARRAVGETAARRLLDMLWQCRNLPDVRSLVGATIPGSKTGA